MLLDHELVHAVIGGFAEPPPFFSEGAAEALRGRRLVNLAAPEPVANFERSLEDVAYGSAGLFMRWLWERDGDEPFVALLRDDREPKDAFAAVYGLTPEAAELLFFDELPYAYPPLSDCAHPGLVAGGVEQWSESVVLDCARDDVYGGEGEPTNPARR